MQYCVNFLIQWRKSLYNYVQLCFFTMMIELVLIHFPKFLSSGVLYGKSMIANISSSESTGIGSPGFPGGEEREGELEGESEEEREGRREGG